MPVFRDAVSDTTTTTGTGTITLAGVVAVAGTRTISSAHSNADTLYYRIENSGNTEWEVGLGTYTSSGTTLSRDTILASSNSGSAVNFSAGTKNVYTVIPASFRARGTITANDPFEYTQTWNAAGVTFTGLRLNITDTASASASLLADYQLGGSSRMSLRKDGLMTLTSALNGSLTVTSSNTTGTAISVINTSSGGHDVQFFSTGVANGLGAGFFGVYSNTGSTFFFAANTTRFNLTAQQAFGWSNSNSSLATIDTILARDAAATLAQRNGTNAQTFRIYNTYTDASNYERGFVRWATNVLEIGAEAAGTGTLRAVSFPSGTVTASTPWTFSQTWNSGATTFVGLDVNVTNTASGSSSVLLRARTGATDRFTADPAGNVFASRSVRVNHTSANAGVEITGAGGGVCYLGSTQQIVWSAGSSLYTNDIGLARSAAGVLVVTNSSTGGGAIEMREQTAPSAPSTNNVRIYAEDNGSGKTRLMALFPTGAAQQIAIEP